MPACLTPLVMEKHDDLTPCQDTDVSGLVTVPIRIRIRILVTLLLSAYLSKLHVCTTEARPEVWEWGVEVNFREEAAAFTQHGVYMGNGLRQIYEI